MSEIAISVDAAAKDLSGLLDLLERKRTSAMLLREGKLVATLSPMPSAARTCAELAERWPQLEKLTPDEANSFADDLDHARLNLPSIKPAWD
jgi:hypothetical protein